MRERLPLALILSHQAVRQTGLDWFLPKIINFKNRQLAVYTAYQPTSVIAVVEDIRPAGQKTRRFWYAGVLDLEDDTSYLKLVPNLIHKKYQRNHQQLSRFLLASVGMASYPETKKQPPQPPTNFPATLEELKKSA